MNIIDLKNVKSDTFSEKIQYGLNFADDAITIRVKDIIKNVQTRGIKACIEYTKQFDNSSLNPENVVIDVKNIKTDFKPPKAFSKAIDAAVKNITAFHSKQKPLNFKIKNKDSFMGERWNPLDRVGCYVPGGTAPLISTVLMTVIPARIARVKEIIVCAPPGKTDNINPYILYVCKKMGVSNILNLGGAQGIAALALGFDGFLPVQKIVGPGNKYVTEAKRQVYGIVDIDMLAGPSEVCILADEKTPVEFVVADLFSQLEHDKDASGVVISTSSIFLKNLILQLEKAIQSRERISILEQSIKNLKFIKTSDITSACKIIDYVAPEHLQIMIENFKSLEKYPFKAGAVFFGYYTPVPVGDFFGGTNHVLPTNRRASFSSPLSVYDFYRRSHFIHYSKNKLLKNAALIEKIAEVEQLPSHKYSITSRII